MNKEEQMLQKRLLELSSIAYQRDIVTFSDFLNLNELHILQSIPKNELSSRYELFGGYEYAERQMVAFLPDALCYEYEYPIEVLRVSAVHKKYAESLTHRDYLGALLNLGIERSKIGDLAVTDDACLIFCHADMSDFICKEFTRVRHTLVSVERMQLSEFHYVPERTEIKGNVRTAVFNSGSPIPEEELERIWEKFYKVDKARTREYGGNGIGLSIVKAIMDSHGQSFGVSNKNDGVEFWFELELYLVN